MEFYYSLYRTYLNLVPGLQPHCQWLVKRTPTTRTMNVDEDLTAGYFKVFPNSASEQLTVISDNVFEGICSLELTDVLGRVTLTKLTSPTEGVTLIGLGNVRNGVYCLTIKVGNKIIQKSKIVVKK